MSKLSTIANISDQLTSAEIAASKQDWRNAMSRFALAAKLCRMAGRNKQADAAWQRAAAMARLVKAAS